MSKNIRAAIVGCGGIAKVHAKCLSQIENVKLIAFADKAVEKAETFSQEFKGNYYASLEDMISLEEIDVLHICTPHYLHVPMAVYALEHGIHVFMEKPPVISYEQLKQLQNVSTDQYLGICFQNRYNPSVIQVKKLLDSGVPGKITGGRAIVTWSRGEEYYTQSGWRGELKTEGGGVLINQAIHTLDLLTLFLGKPLKAEAVLANHHLKGIIEVEDMMEAWITYQDNRNACFYATTAYGVDMPPLIEIVCENMTIRMEELEVTCYEKSGKVTHLPIEAKGALGKSYWGAGHMDCIRDFYNSITKHLPFLLSLKELEDTVLLMLGIYESARTRQEILIGVADKV